MTHPLRPGFASLVPSSRTKVRRSAVALVRIVFVAFCAASVALAQLGTSPTQVKLTASDASAGDRFGESVAIQSARIAVGAPLDDHAGGADAGSVYAYAPSGSTWVQEARLSRLDVTAGAEFGRSVALSADTLVVGAWRDARPAGLRSGSVFVYTRSGSGWGVPQRLVAPDALAGDEFGASVAVYGDWLAVGAPSRATGGGVYLFNRTSGVWLLRQKLSSFRVTSSTADAFGWSLALESDALTVGLPGWDIVCCPPIADYGMVLTFRRYGTTWAPSQTLWGWAYWNGSTYVGSNFGRAVATGGGSLVVADLFYPKLFTRSGPDWVFRQTLVTPSASNYLPAPRVDVGVSACTLASGDRSFGGSFGLVNRYRRAGPTWYLLDLRTLATDFAFDDQFGSSVAVEGSTIVCGAPSDDTASGIDFGSAYVLPQASCAANEWSLVHPGGAGAPPARAHHSMAQTANGSVLLFGGVDGNDPVTYFSDTWEWNGSVWTRRFPPIVPPARRAFAMVHCTHTLYANRTVMFGGVNGGATALSDMWQWDGGNWLPITNTGDLPGPISGQRAVWDTNRECMVVYGHVFAQAPNDRTDTWEWRRTSASTGAWTRIQTSLAVNPGHRLWHAMAYDATRRVTVLHGGMFTNPADTWTWNGATWTQVATTGTGALQNHVMGFDPAIGNIVMTAALGPSGTYPPLTWTWNGSSWTSVPATSVGPGEARINSAMAWDPVHRGLMLFGGHSNGGGGPLIRSDTRRWCSCGD